MGGRDGSGNALFALRETNGTGTEPDGTNRTGVCLLRQDRPDADNRDREMGRKPLGSTCFRDSSLIQDSRPFA